jgi:hypothetical protein
MNRSDSRRPATRLLVRVAAVVAAVVVLAMSCLAPDTPVSWQKAKPTDETVTGLGRRKLGVYLDAARSNQVPWSIVAAAAAVATNHGERSPFDSVTHSGFPTVTPPIRHPDEPSKYGQGPFLLLGRHTGVQSAATSAGVYARWLVKAAGAEFGKDLAEATVDPFAFRTRWESVVAKAPVKWEPSPVLTDDTGDTPADPTPDVDVCVPAAGTDPVEAIGAAIRCYAKDRTVTLESKSGPITGDDAVEQLVGEARLVAAAFSGSGRVPCDETAVYAGVLPVAGDVTGRCDPETNVAAVAKRLVDTASSARPSGFAGVAAEWAQFPWVFGSADRFLTEGWQGDPPKACVDLAATQVAATPDVWGEVDFAAPDTHHVVEELWDVHPARTTVQSSPVCAGWVTPSKTVTVVASAAATIDGPSPAVAAFSRWVADTAEPEPAQPGVTSVLPRLSNPPVVAPTSATPAAPSSDPPAAGGAVESAPGKMDATVAARYATLVMDQAAKYSGVAVCGSAGVSGGAAAFGTANVNGIPPTVAAAYLSASALMTKMGRNVPPALIAGIGKIETGHGTYRGATTQPDGSNTPRIIGIDLPKIRDTDGGALDGSASFDRAIGPAQFIPGTFFGSQASKAEVAAMTVRNGYGLDGNGDGRVDPFNVFDAYAATANYLSSTADTRDLSGVDAQRRAIFRYNHSTKYVNDVLAAASGYTPLFAQAAAGATPASTPGSTTAATTAASTAPTALTPAVGGTVFMLGDSITVGAQPKLPSQFPGWTVTVDAKVGRFLNEAIPIAQTRRNEITGVAVVHLGNNYGGNQEAFRQQVDQMMTALNGVKLVVWVTVAEDRPTQTQVNTELRSIPARYPNAAVIDWTAEWAAHRDYTGGDHLHLTGKGSTAFASFVANGVRRVATEHGVLAGTQRSLVVVTAPYTALKATLPAVAPFAQVIAANEPTGGLTAPSTLVLVGASPPTGVTATRTVTVTVTGPTTPAAGDTIDWVAAVAADPTLTEPDGTLTAAGATKLAAMIAPFVSGVTPATGTTGCPTASDTTGSATAGSFAQPAGTVTTAKTAKGTIQVMTVTTGNGQTTQVNVEIAGAVTALFNDAKTQGVPLSGWGFRSYESQVRLRTTNHCPDVFTAPASSCRPPTARPGNSQHEQGLAIDFTLGGSTLTRSSPGFAWMQANAAKYGLKNLPSEPWHWSTTGR